MKLISIILFLTLFQGCKPKFKLDTVSMEPTIPLGSSLTIDFEAYKDNPPKRFDIVMFQISTPKVERVFRIIGLPNETIEVCDGFVKVDGETLKTPKSTKYFKVDKDTITPKTFNVVVLQGNEYYVLADNRAATDSRYIGPIKTNQIIGKVIKIE